MLENMNHSSRVRYCEKHFAKIGAGSGRIVFRLSDTRVLKIAKNPKGLAQNEAEILLFNDGYISTRYQDMFAKIYESDPEYTWIVMELVNKVKPSEFRKKFGISIQDFDRVTQLITGGSWYTVSEVYEEYRKGDLEDSNPVLHGLIALCEDLYHSCSYSIGDFGRISSFGKVNERIVLVDYGLTQEIYKRYYLKQSRYNY